MKKYFVLIAVLLAVLIGLFVHLFRYEYRDIYVRNDRLTGEVQWYCRDTLTWATEPKLCPAPKAKSVVDIPEPGLSLNKPVTGKCYSMLEYKKSSEAKGQLCVDLPDGFGCGTDKDRNNILEPWEINWFQKEDTRKCSAGEYFVRE